MSFFLYRNKEQFNIICKLEVVIHIYENQKDYFLQ